MATDDLKRMESSIVDFANKLEKWVEKRNDTLEGSDSTLFSTDEPKGIDLKTRIQRERLERKRQVFDDSRRLVRFIQKRWSRSKSYSGENVVNFLRLVYLDFDRMQRVLDYTNQHTEDSLYLILDVLQDAIFECEMCLFELKMKDWDYLQKEQEDTIRLANVMAQCQDETPVFSPYPECKSYNLKGDAKHFSDKYDVPFAVDKISLDPEGNVMIRCAADNPFYVENAKDAEGNFDKRDFESFIKGRFLRDILILAMKVFPELRDSVETQPTVFVAPFMRSDFPHLTSDGRRFYRWFTIHF